MADASKFGFLVSTVSRKRSNQTELRAYRQMAVPTILMAALHSGNLPPSAHAVKDSRIARISHSGKFGWNAKSWVRRMGAEP